MHIVKLGEIASIYNGNSINSKVKQDKYMKNDPGWNYIGTKDVNTDGTINYHTGVIIPFSENTFKIAPTGTVFVCSEGGSAGKKTALVTQDVCFGNKLFAVVNTSEKYLNKYLFYYTRYEGFKQQFVLLATSLMGGISAKNFASIKMPLPPIEEQARIVARIEELFSQLESGVETLKQTKAQLTVYRQAVLSCAFPELTDINKKLLTEIADITGGITKGRHLEGQDVIELPYLRVANVQDGYLDLSEMKTIQLKRSEREKYLLQYNDVLYTEGGDRDKLGRGTVWRNEIPDCVHQNHIFKARINQELAIPQYVAYWSLSRNARNYFFTKGKQTVNLASINKTVLSNLPLPIPTLEEQRKTISEIEDRLSVCDQIEQTVDAALQQAEALRQSILKKAFEGGL